MVGIASRMPAGTLVPSQQICAALSLKYSSKLFDEARKTLDDFRSVNYVKIRRRFKRVCCVRYEIN
jgi:hypothetical protein